jgi:hypothetical protein
MKPTSPGSPSANPKFLASSERFWLGHGHEGAEGGFQPLPGLPARHELGERRVRGLATAQGHELDEAHVPAAGPGLAHEVHHVRVVVVAGDHAVDLDRRKARLLGGREAGLDLLHGAEAHEPLQALGMEGVHVHVHPAQAGFHQGPGQTVQEHRVRGHRDLAHVLHPGHALHDLDQVGAEGGLSPGQAEPAEAHVNRGFHHGLDLGGGQEVGEGMKVSPRSGMQ